MGVGAEIVGYNLGTVFYALGEAASARDLWNEVVPGENQELAFRLVYNQGILNYRNGAYPEAYESFKSALLLNPASMAAKVNLEHSLAKMNAREAGSQEVAPGASPPRRIPTIFSGFWSIFGGRSRCVPLGATTAVGPGRQKIGSIS